MKGTPSLWLVASPLMLASSSATRRDMLIAAGVPVETVKPSVDERAIELPLREAGQTPAHIALALAAAKALAVSSEHPERLVLGADQTLACAGETFNKPADQAAAARQIAALAGRSHELHSAFALVRSGQVLAEGHETARLSMRRLAPTFIAAYLETVGDAALTSVGGYQIEGLGAQLFERIEGDHFTILGLPLLPVLAALRDLSALAR